MAIATAIWTPLPNAFYNSNTSTSSHTHITPEQVAAIAASNGFAHAEDPATHRVYLLVEQGQAPTLSDDYFRQKKLTKGSRKQIATSANLGTLTR